MIFLSAGIPEHTNENDFFTSSDIVAIRDAVRSLAEVTITSTKLVYGGHPSITLLIRYILYKTEPSFRSNVILYQSEFFKNSFPKDNEFITDKKIVPMCGDLESSLSDMRSKMIQNHDFKAGFFIGGKGGVIQEYNLFKKTHPKAAIFPIASTGAAAKALYHLFNFSDKKLVSDFAYKTLFKNILSQLT